MFLSEERVSYWNQVDEKNPDLPKYKDSYRKAVTQKLLENTEKAIKGELQGMDESVTVTQAGANPLANWDPILINLVRRATPNLMAFDIAGVQPMSGPTGLIFALKSRYTAQNSGLEALHNAADTGFSGDEVAESMASAAYYAGTATAGGAITTAQGETLGGPGGGDLAWNDMSFSIEKSSVTAKTRALKAEYTTEVAHDLKQIHGLDAENELANILSTEIIAEQNREIVHNLRKVAKVAAASVTYSNGSIVVGTNGPVYSAAGLFNLDTNSDGRWSAEKYKSLLVKIHREANAIAKDTRRGRGNFIVVSSDVAAILDLTGKLVYAPAIDDSFNYDDTGNTFVGTLSGRYKVFVDPYSSYDEVIVGYRGSNAWDAGFYYCPYVPLQMVKAQDPNTFQPKIAFKTRYGLVSNPFAKADGTLEANTNPYFRKFRVTGI